jgi:FMN phosphatase YigB (HAD superfamily)
MQEPEILSGGSAGLSAVQAIVFDLDDTLIEKSEWIIPAMEFASVKLGLDPTRVWDLAARYVQAHGCADAGIYNHVLLECGQSDSAMNIRAFVAWANQFEPKPGALSLHPGAREALESLGRRYRLGVIADGPVACQKAKLRGSGLDRLVHAVMYSDEIDGIRSRRPDPRPFRRILADLGIRGPHTLFVADNPLKDFQKPRDLGFITVRVLTGEYANHDYPTREHAADYDLSSVARLPDLLAGVSLPRRPSSALQSASITATDVPPSPPAGSLAS